MNATADKSDPADARNRQASIRKEMRQRRRALSLAERRQSAQAACRLLKRSSIFHRSPRVAVYFAANGELDPAPLLEIALRRKKTCYVPVLDGARRRTMWFAPITQNTPLRRNHLGILEPVHTAGRRIHARHLNLVIVPLIAFDQHGNRIGMGGGYYDHTFAFLLQRRGWRKPRLFGYAYSFQRVDGIACNPWDVNLDGVVTEQKLYLTKRDS
jgi:5-formyltetrahydrofolate cyclo-ligase